MRHHRRVLNLFLAFTVATTAVSVPREAQAFCCLFEWCKNLCKKPTTPATFVAPVATAPPPTFVPTAPAVVPVMQQQVQYVPQTCYRTVYTNVPVTTMRPVTAIDPCTGCRVTSMRPETTMVQRAQLVPYTTYSQVVTNVPVMQQQIQMQQQMVVPQPGAVMPSTQTGTTFVPSTSMPSAPSTGFATPTSPSFGTTTTPSLSPSTPITSQYGNQSMYTPGTSQSTSTLSPIPPVTIPSAPSTTLAPVAPPAAISTPAGTNEVGPSTQQPAIQPGTSIGQPQQQTGPLLNYNNGSESGAAAGTDATNGNSPSTSSTYKPLEPPRRFVPSISGIKPIPTETAVPTPQNSTEFTAPKLLDPNDRTTMRFEPRSLTVSTSEVQRYGMATPVSGMTLLPETARDADGWEAAH